MRTPLLVLVTGFTLSSVTCGQRLYFGVVGGTNVTANSPVTDIMTPADVFGNPANRFQCFTGPASWIVALVEARTSGLFSIEAGVLHRPMNAAIIYTEFPAHGPTTVYTGRFTAVRAARERADSAAGRRLSSLLSRESSVCPLRPGSL